MATKTVKLTATVEELLECSDIQELYEEMNEWASNMEDNNLGSTPKFDEVTEARDTLERADELDGALGELKSAMTEYNDGDEWLSIKIEYSAIKSASRNQPRWARLGMNVAGIRAVIDWLEAIVDDIQKRLSEAEKAIDETSEDANGHEDGIEAEREKIMAVEEARGNVEDLLDELDGVTFPGMY